MNTMYIQFGPFTEFCTVVFEFATTPLLVIIIIHVKYSEGDEFQWKARTTVDKWKQTQLFIKESYAESKMGQVGHYFTGKEVEYNPEYNKNIKDVVQKGTTKHNTKTQRPLSWERTKNPDYFDNTDSTPQQTTSPL